MLLRQLAHHDLGEERLSRLGAHRTEFLGVAELWHNLDVVVVKILSKQPLKGVALSNPLGELIRFSGVDDLRERNLHGGLWILLLLFLLRTHQLRHNAAGCILPDPLKQIVLIRLCHLRPGERFTRIYRALKADAKAIVAFDAYLYLLLCGGTVLRRAGKILHQRTEVLGNILFRGVNLRLHLLHLRLLRLLLLLLHRRLLLLLCLCLYLFLVLCQLVLQRTHAGVFRNIPLRGEGSGHIPLRRITHGQRVFLLAEVVQMAQLFLRKLQHTVGKLHPLTLVGAAPVLVGVLLQLVGKIRLRAPQQLAETLSGKDHFLCGGLFTEMHTRHIIQRIAHILKRGGGAPFFAPSVAAFRQRLRFLVQSLTEELA